MKASDWTDKKNINRNKITDAQDPEQLFDWLVFQCNNMVQLMNDLMDLYNTGFRENYPTVVDDGMFIYIYICLFV